MDKIGRWIADYRAEMTQSLPDPDGSSKKVGVIIDLEDYIDNQQVLKFFLEVASDETDYDLARIEVLKILGIAPIDDEEKRRQIGLVLGKIVGNDPDDDVRNYAAMASASYMMIDEVADEIDRVLFDRGQDINLRWNAFTAIEQMGPTPRSLEMMRSIRRDIEFRESADRILRDWQAAH